VDMQQADYMWVFQLYKDRHVVAQVLCVRAFVCVCMYSCVCSSV
jgi:hypothetical protein